ncbi:hypothetical protein [Clostridium sp. Marseille-P2415]|uniref:hypothetical protein n=1 Tax=Clostridium sp. Marseille-P2415 TaxID=1805471 RepID=UPI00190EF30B|nr:hypothetical protein [Clostridium sp. Marseille-P2415]
MVICTDKSDPCVAEALPVPVAIQLGVSAVFGPVTVADIPVLAGVPNPHVLVKTVAVTVSPAVIILSLMFKTKPVIVALNGNVTLLVANNVMGDEVPSPIQPPLLTD